MNNVINNPATVDSIPVCCYHCGEVVPPGIDIRANIMGVEQPMCCQGCRAVALMINDSGLADYYRYRTGLPGKPDTDVSISTASLAAYDNPGFQKTFVRVQEDGLREASLILEGMVCPACAWVNETHLAGLRGIKSISVNFTTGKALVRWYSNTIQFSEILARIFQLGYKAYPCKPGLRRELLDREKKYLLTRLGVAGLLGMQVMMIAIALYAGEWQGIDSDHMNFLRWTSLILTTPVLFFSAQPFFKNSFRALRKRRLVMDVPVALGISIACIASLHATINNSGAVYFDTVVMLVFFLLTGRYLEINARDRATRNLDNMEKIQPVAIPRRHKSDTTARWETIPVYDVEPHDLVLIRPGECIPVDGVITEGTTTVNESALTGESFPVTHQPGDRIFSGMVNIDSPIQVEVTATGSATALSHICRMIESAQSEKSGVTLLVDRLAAWFLSLVLLITVLAGVYWWNVDRELWVSVVIATLVVSCPCALSLATPVSISIAIHTLLKRGIAITRSEVLQTITRITHLVFDKTGTLTEGRLQIQQIRSLKESSEAELLSIACGLESQSEHPVAIAFRNMQENIGETTVANVRNSPGEGISGLVNGKKYYLGTAEFIHKHLPDSKSIMNIEELENNHVVYLADDQEIIGNFSLTDQPRPDIDKVISFFKRRNIDLRIASGDNRHAVAELASKYGIDKVYARYKPEDKLALVKELQRSGGVVAMTGDGINDAPVLAASDVSIAMGSAADLARIQADVVLTGSRLSLLIDMYKTARLCMRIIRQNLTWAILYNLLALPAAVSGLLAPWMAALGMSASSLIVTLNSLRLKKIPE